MNVTAFIKQTPVGIIEVNNSAYGAKGDGITDDTVALQKATAALADGYSLYFVPGSIYLVSDTIEIANKLFITVQGNNAIITTKSTSDFTNKPLFSLKGTGYSTIYNLKINSTLQTSKQPVVGLLQARSNITYHGGGNLFISCHIYGYYSATSVYDVGTECYSFINCNLQSNNSSPVMIISNTDDYNLGLYLSSNVRKHFLNCNFRQYGGETATNIVLKNGYEITFDHCYLADAVNGIAFDITGVVQNLILKDLRVEGSGLNSRLLRNNITTLSYLKISDVVWTVSSDYMIESSKSILQSNIDLFGYTAATKYIHMIGTAILANDMITGNIDAGIVLDGDSSGAQLRSSVLRWGAGWPVTGGYSEYDRISSGNENIIFAAEADSHSTILLPSIRTRTGVFTDKDTTPSILGHTLWSVENTGATAITNFDNPEPGQTITLLFNDAVTTLVHGATIKLNGGINIIGTIGSTISLVYDTSNAYWRETSRSIV